MLTPEEMQSTEAALVAARAEVERLTARADAVDAARLWGVRWLFPSKERTEANTARSLVEAATNVRNVLAESPDYDHEEALHVVQLANEIATPGWLTNTLRDSTVGDVVGRKAGELWAALPSGSTTWAWAKVLIGIVVVLLVLSIVVPLVAPFLPFFVSRRRA